MSDKDTLKGKKILIVDDEPDVLDILEGLLSMCTITKADNFESARRLMETEPFDIAILDIMGVNGYALLEITKEKKITAVMLTAHALSVETTVKSFKRGAASYVPKEEIHKIEAFLNDVLEAKSKGQSSWLRWLERAGAYYEKKFGRDWQKGDEEFWRNFPSV